MDYPSALPHDLPKQIAEDVFVVHGCVKPNTVVRFSRNMAIVRDKGELTLINPVRMSEAGLVELDKLGKVAHVIRLAPSHGMDDPFYVDRYKAEFWSLEGGTTYTEPKITQPLIEGGQLPFSNAKLFAFKYMHEPEAAILLERSEKREQGLLFTCDAVQSYESYPHTNWLARRVLPLIGFTKETLISKMWVKLAVANQEGIKTEFDRLLELDFDQLLGGHGTFVAKNAHAEVKCAIDNKFS
jgi:hypothetical protein